MTAFRNLPPSQHFLRAEDPGMLRMRLEFTQWLQEPHKKTLAKHSDIKTPEMKDAAYEQWQSRAAKRHKAEGPPMPCPCYNAMSTSR